MKLYIFAYGHQGLSDDARRLLLERSDEYNMINRISSVYVTEGNIVSLTQSVIAKERKVALAS